MFYNIRIFVVTLHISSDNFVSVKQSLLDFYIGDTTSEQLGQVLWLCKMVIVICINYKILKINVLAVYCGKLEELDICHHGG